MKHYQAKRAIHALRCAWIFFNRIAICFTTNRCFRFVAHGTGRRLSIVETVGWNFHLLKAQSNKYHQQYGSDEFHYVNITVFLWK